MEQIVSATEELSVQEKSLLFKRMLGVWLVGIFMAVFITYLFFFIGDDTEFREPSFLWLFPLLFYGVLAYIIYSDTRNAFQKNKSVYTGIVTEKQTKASQVSRESSVKQSFRLCLVDTWFNVEFAIYSKVRVGDKVKLHCLDRTVVFKAEVLDSADESVSHVLKPYLPDKRNTKAAFSLLDLTPCNPVERKIIGANLWRAIVYRVGLSLVLSVVCYFVVFLFVILSFRTEGIMLIRVVNFGLMLILVAFYVYRNIATWQLLRDLLDAQKFNVTEEIIDKVASTNKKPSPNSVLVVNGNTANYNRYFYLQTSSFWIPVSESEYQMANVGECLDVSLAKNSKAVLEVKPT